MRFNTDNYRSLNESIARVQNPQGICEKLVADLSIEDFYSPDEKKRKRIVPESKPVLPRSTQVGQFKIGQWEDKYYSVRREAESAMKKLAPQQFRIAQFKKMEDLWRRTWYKMMYDIIWNLDAHALSAGKPSKSRLASAGKKMDNLYAKWEQSWEKMLAAVTTRR